MNEIFKTIRTVDVNCRSILLKLLPDDDQAFQFKLSDHVAKFSFLIEKLIFVKAITFLSAIPYHIA